MERIEKLREAALCHVHDNSEFFYLFHKQYGVSEGRTDYQKYADAFFFAFSHLTPRISAGELIVGKTGGGFDGAERAEWESTYRALAEERSRAAGAGQGSHMAIDYELLLTHGIDGIVARIDSLLSGCRPEQEDFYRAARTCLLAVVEHSRRYAACAEALAKGEQDAVRREELLELSRICRRVPASPAGSFYEAVQSVHFVTYCISLNPLRLGCQQFQLGHPDRYLLPYYERDVARGILTREGAQLILDCLGVQINTRVHSGLSSGYMVGGRDKEGRVVANELSRMLLQVIDDVRLVYPAVGLCYTEELPSELLALSCRLLLRGRSHPAIFNDDVIFRGLRHYGVGEAEAHSYIHSTCVEITPVASSNVWVASPYTNMAQLLLDTMTEEYPSFEDHLGAVLSRLDKSIRASFLAQNALRAHRAKHSMNPLLSCFVNDCLARGIDIERGGARYNWIMPSFVGMANLVDSLFALQSIVYDERAYTVKELKEILDADFEGHEELRRHLLDDIPKYGNDDDRVDALFGRITDHIVSECERYEGMHTSGRLIPSVFCWVKHEEFGRQTGATPDGRVAGFPLGDGSGPCQGRERMGPTASILSSTKWEHEKLLGGVAVNMKFARSTLGESSPDVLAALIRAFMQRGGFEMQINVTDRELLLRAMERPEEYRDLVVRIGGYSDYFTRLSAKMQQEVLLRTEHRI